MVKTPVLVTIGTEWSRLCFKTEAWSKSCRQDFPFLEVIEFGKDFADLSPWRIMCLARERIPHVGALGDSCMVNNAKWLLAATVLAASWLAAQNASQDLTVQVSPAQAWTDTGLDLQAGEVISITASAGPSTSATQGLPACDPAGITNSSAGSGALPLTSAAPGALIARLHAQGAAPLLVGASNDLQIQESSHLYLGLNLSGDPPCQGSITVKVHRGSQQQARGAQLRSQLATAAQIFMQGQFGDGKSNSANAGSANAVSSEGTSGSDATTAAPVLKVSDAPLDKELRRDLDSLPRRVNDQFNNLGDMVNFVIVGSEKDLQAALDVASWHVADTNNEKAVVNAIEETFDKKDYLQMPMSTLYLFGRKQDFGYEMAEPIAMVASRNHFRIWKAPFTWKGQEVWVGAGTHDIGFAKDKRNGNVTHKIDPAVDGERDNIGSSLQKADKTKTIAYYLPPDPVQEAKNATGDGYHSDGRLLVIFLQ
jgi:hypothetical protein